MLVTAFVYFRRNVYTHIETSARASVLTAINDCVNLAAADFLKGYNYEDLVHVTKGADNKPIMMQADSVQLSVIARAIGTACQEKINTSMPENIQFYSGSFFDKVLFSSKGDFVDIPLRVISNVSTDIQNVFIASGINQTRHSIFVVLRVDSDVVQPLITETLKFKTVVLLAETILIGEVPEVFIDSLDGLQYLDLIP